MSRVCVLLLSVSCVSVSSFTTLPPARRAHEIAPFRPATQAGASSKRPGLQLEPPFFLFKKDPQKNFPDHVLSLGGRVRPLRSSSNSDTGGSGLSLSAYDQLVLSVRALSTREIKQELVTRGVGFSDCFEKHELVARLVEARLQLAAEAIGEGAVDAGAGVASDSADNELPDDASIEYDTSQIKQDTRIFDEEMKKKLAQKDKVEKMLQDEELMAALRNPAVMAMAQQVLADPSSASSYAQDPEVAKAIEKVKEFLKNNT